MPDFKKLSNSKTPEAEEKPCWIKPKRIPIKKDVPIKANLTTVMREAALFAKEKESCIKEINEILKGGVDTHLTKSFEQETREKEEQKQIEEAERKRLRCLLSHEEAIIAKYKLKELNMKRKYEMLEEKDKLIKQLNEWKAEEKEKYKTYIKMAHESRRNAKESEMKMVEEKQGARKLMQWETKILLSKAMKEKEEELARRMHIIQEIKAISQVKAIDTSKEFDKTECPNLGLLCEMSIAELEERLYLMNEKMKKELEEKRKRILEQKEEKQRMVQEAKEFIQQNRTMKEKPPVRTVVKTEENPDIKDLRKKLERAKKMRKACNLCPCRPCPLILRYGSK
ncbi:hypothetical protein HHI36_004302 [Cryptolaemus montrouzieri]|uniref:Uncharacterized protein n=1 Tax=Cryptolaemus montrouzieri TaxID=559131 RepID=A0ABD2NR87_9CUCU